MSMDFKHISVLLEESVQNLNIKDDGTYVDCTLGGGGHSQKILTQLSSKGTLIGIDRDQEALAAAGKRLEQYSNAVYVHDNFHNIKHILNDLNIDYADGIIADLGVSSYQLDNRERGFSYMEDARLDMRMDSSAELDAYKIVNTYSEEKLADIIFRFGEEKFARKIARLICEKRKEAPLETTMELVDIIKRAIPERFRQKGSHPAKRTFQAIRIEVNGELEPLGQAVEDMFDCLRPGGRLSIITFHSLEDRIVKNKYQELATGCTCPPQFPVCVCGKTPRGKIITRKPILPTDDECEYNKRSKSAKLRIIEKL